MATTWQATTKTFLEAKTEVAGTVGGATQAAVLTAAGESIADAVREWNRFHNWYYCLTNQSTIGINASGSDYDLVATFKAPYSVQIVVGSPRPLKYVERRRWDRVVYNQLTPGRTEFYTLWNSGQAGKITLFPTPNETIADALAISFFRNIVVPSVDGTALDLPDHYVDSVLDLARAKLLARRGGRMDLIRLFEAKGQDGMRKARADDMDSHDGDAGFIPVAEHEGRRFSDFVGDFGQGF